LKKQVFWVVATCGWVICSGRLEETYSLRPQGYESVTPNPEDEGDRCLRNAGRNLSNHRRNNPEDLLSERGNKFATNDLSALCYFRLVKRQHCRYTSLSFSTEFFLSVACYASDKKCRCNYDRCPYI